MKSVARSRKPPPPSATQPDFVLTEDGELVAADRSPDEEDDLAQDLVLEGPADGPSSPPVPPPAPPSVAPPVTPERAGIRTPQPSAIPTIQGTPLPRVEPTAKAEDSIDLDIELDDRSLADIAYESSMNLPQVGLTESVDLDSVDVVDPPPPARTAGPAPVPTVRGAPEAPGHRVRPSNTGAASVMGMGERQRATSTFRPRVMNRPVREKARTDAFAGSTPVDPAIQQAELLYQEALKEAAVGNVAAARRHLQLALTYVPQHPQYIRALHSLGHR